MNYCLGGIKGLIDKAIDNDAIQEENHKDNVHIAGIVESRKINTGNLLTFHYVCLIDHILWRQFGFISIVCYFSYSVWF